MICKEKLGEGKNRAVIDFQSVPRYDACAGWERAWGIAHVENPTIGRGMPSYRGCLDDQQSNQRKVYCPRRPAKWPQP
jgi:hypothetical protein